MNNLYKVKFKELLSGPRVAEKLNTCCPRCIAIYLMFWLTSSLEALPSTDSMLKVHNGQPPIDPLVFECAREKKRG